MAGKFSTTSLHHSFTEEGLHTPFQKDELQEGEGTDMDEPSDCGSGTQEGVLSKNCLSPELAPYSKGFKKFEQK